ncbi:MAG TPA: DMT family transporter [Bacteroidales bacterium]|nr:DMT family transporter [Bacteroidales bacterium]
MNTKNPLLVYIPILLAMIFWSFSFIWYKQVYEYYLPVTVIVLRLVIAIPLLFMLSAAAGKLQRIRREHLKWFLLLGFFEPFLYFMGESYGVSMISPTLAAIIISLIPLLAPIPARYFFKEKFTFTNSIGLVISVAGVMLVIAGDNDAKPAAVAGVMLMILAVIAAVFYSVFVKKLADNYSSFTIVTYQNVIGLVYFIPVFLLTEFNHFMHADHTLKSFIPVFKLALFASVFAFLLFVFSIKRMGIARTNVFANLIPVFTAILSYFILDEKFGPLKIAGIITVIAGTVFTQYNHRIRPDS